MKLNATVSDEIFKDVKQLVKLGLFENVSQTIEVALKKMLAGQAREYLRNTAKNLNLTKEEMIEEWEKVRG